MISAKEYKEERDQLAEHMNQISEALLGHRGGTIYDMITTANYLKKTINRHGSETCKDD